MVSPRIALVPLVLAVGCSQDGLADDDAHRDLGAPSDMNRVVPPDLSRAPDLAPATAPGFGAMSPLAAPSNELWAVRIGDLDGDGKLDLLLVTTTSAGILAGRGDGSFLPFRAIWAEPLLTNATLADLDGDGALDVILCTGTSYTDGQSALLTLRNRGDGTFDPPFRLDLEGQAQSVVAADLDGDGHLDLAVVRWCQSIATFRGVGDGTVTALADYPIADEPMSVAAGDLDGDGRADLVTGNGYHTASVLLGVGGGAFAAPVAYSTMPDVTSGWGIALGDLDGDGHLDVAVAVGPDDLYLVVLHGAGDGTLGAATAIPISQGLYAIALADLDRDGRLDIALARWPGSGTYDATTVLLNRGAGRFEAQDLPSPDGNLNSIAVGDLDGDGWLDLAVTDWDAQTASGLGILLQ